MKISGHVDLCGPELIEGWLYCDAWENEPINLQVFIAGELLGECTADRFRNDLQEAGFGDGRCGFSFPVPETHIGANFADTRLRLLQTPVYLLPDEFSNVASQTDPAAAGFVGDTEDPPDYMAPLRIDTQEAETRSSSGKPRGSMRTLYSAR